MYLEDREEAYKIIKTIKEEFELCKQFAQKYDSFRTVCNRLFTTLKNEGHQHLLDNFKEDLMRCGLLDENGQWKMVRVNEEWIQK